MRSGTGEAVATVFRQLPVTPRPGDADTLVRAMADVLARQRPESAAEALKVLRIGFPEFPLALRLAAVAAAMKWADRLPRIAS